MLDQMSSKILWSIVSKAADKSREISRKVCFSFASLIVIVQFVLKNQKNGKSYVDAVFRFLFHMKRFGLYCDVRPIVLLLFERVSFKRKKERKKELNISETHQKYYDLNTNNKKEQSIRFGSSSVHLKESFLKALCGNNFMFFFKFKVAWCFASLQSSVCIFRSCWEEVM